MFDPPNVPGSGEGPAGPRWQWIAKTPQEEVTLHSVFFHLPTGDLGQTYRRTGRQFWWRTWAG